MLTAGTYGFKDVIATVTGPGGTVTFTGQADEGYALEFEGDKSTMTTGAGGDVMHSVRVTQSGMITFNLLQTSLSNAQLQALYDYQNLTPARAGRNTITIRDLNVGDNVVGLFCAFRKFPNLSWATLGGTRSWAFNVGQMSPVLGDGTQPAIV